MDRLIEASWRVVLGIDNLKQHLSSFLSLQNATIANTDLFTSQDRPMLLAPTRAGDAKANLRRLRYASSKAFRVHSNAARLEQDNVECLRKVASLNAVCYRPSFSEPSVLKLGQG